MLLLSAAMVEDVGRRRDPAGEPVAAAVPHRRDRRAGRHTGGEQEAGRQADRGSRAAADVLPPPAPPAWLLLLLLLVALQVWSGPLVGDAHVVLLFNRHDNDTATIRAPWDAVGLSRGQAYEVTDVWSHTTTHLVAERGAAIEAAVAPHGVMMYRVSPAVALTSVKHGRRTAAAASSSSRLRTSLLYREGELAAPL